MPGDRGTLRETIEGGSSVRSIVVIPLALSLALSTGSRASAQSSAPALDNGTTDAGITREAAVALVLATDPRFADLPDFEDVRAAGAAEFRTAEAVLMSDWYRVLGPTATELADLGMVSLRHPGSWLIETSLVEACADPEGDIEFPMADPCAWRHSWYHLVSPDGSVTLLGDEGDPELSRGFLDALDTLLWSQDSDAYPGIGWSRGTGHAGDAALIALAEAIGVPLEALFVDEITARDEQDQWLILAQGFSSEGAEPTAMLDGILAWQSADWARHFETAPVNEELEDGDRSVLRTTFPIDAAGEPYHFQPHRYGFDELVPDTLPGIYLGGDAVQYLYVSGNAALSVIAVDDERALEFLELLP